MKKILIGAQILAAVFLLIKGLSLFGILSETQGLPDVTAIAATALAQSKMPAPEKPPVANSSAAPAQAAKTPLEDALTEQRGLAEALVARQNELDAREKALRADEQRLIALRKDILEKMAILKTSEEKLATRMEALREEDIRRYKEMAKVYEAAPPVKAGPMMEKLDTRTAAGIVRQMKKDKAGALWGYLTPQKAVDITKEITRSDAH
jgi:flagellar motility protein MotE (MotC chaperone)